MLGGGVVVRIFSWLVDFFPKKGGEDGEDLKKGKLESSFPMPSVLFVR